MLTDPQTSTGTNDAPVPPFLVEAASRHMGELVAVHTGQRSYVGRLRSLDSARLILDADSEELDEEVLLHIDTSRVEAIELIPR